MVDFTAHLGKYTKIKQLSRKISQFRQILVFTAKFLSLPLGGTAKFFTAKWQLNSANFSLFGGEFRSSGIAVIFINSTEVCSSIVYTVTKYRYRVASGGEV